jgi:hypothetical protein
MKWRSRRYPKPAQAEPRQHEKLPDSAGSHNAGRSLPDLARLLERLRLKPASLTDVFRSRDLIKQIPDKLLAAEPSLAQMEARYELLSQFHFGLSDELVNTTWKLRALPAQIKGEQVRMRLSLKGLREQVEGAGEDE